MNSPRAILEPRRDLCSSGMAFELSRGPASRDVAAISATVQGSREGAGAGWNDGLIDLTELRIALICCGVVPQHPPTILTPYCTNFFAYEAMYSGEQRYMLRPSIFLGLPALG